MAPPLCAKFSIKMQFIQLYISELLFACKAPPKPPFVDRPTEFFSNLQS